VVNLNINTSSAAKGESLLDTIDNLVAMHADMFLCDMHQAVRRF